ncbi:efflux RND transporter periplasmic adaptor subunit [Myxosarcina sp. GI1]|uniref:efflux RND transporter periplasmic adaptor subunit n=1 Tax=Myxosarcina sp. GI1 TaxID=1541065 RepID=UPI0009079D5C|nr:efflux RND transporter periplasmic adaptor subunit [Myxosarcina sp. GI1]
MKNNLFLERKVTGAVIAIAILVSGCGNKGENANNAQQQQPQAVKVKLKNLTAGKVRDSTQFVGSLEAKQRVSLAPRVDGRIVDIAVNEGDNVERGQLMVQLQLDRERAEVDSASSNVSIQRANVSNAQAEARAAEAEEASAVAAVQEARANLRELESEVELARTNINRSKFLVKEGAQAQQELDNNRRNLETAIARRDSAQEALVAAQKAINAAKARTRAALAEVDSQKASLAQAKAQVNVASQNLDYNRVVAPITGTVGDILPKEGDYVEAGERLTTIAQNEILDLNISVPVERAPDLEVGLPVEIVDDNGEARVSGRISFVSPSVNRTEQSVLAKATFPNNGSLRDEQFVRARVIWSEQSGILVPTEAVSRIGGQSFVFVATEATKKNGETMLIAKQRPVKLGDVQNQSYQVISGVESGDKLVVSGILNLSDGTPIQTATAAKESEEAKEAVSEVRTSNN